MRRQILWLVAVMAIATSALVAAGGAAATGMTQVDGIQTLVSGGDPLDPTDDVFRMDGYGGGQPALVGYWYTRSFVLGVVTPSGVLTSTGTEEFVGCLDANGNPWRRIGPSEDARHDFVTSVTRQVAQR